MISLSIINILAIIFFSLTSNVQDSIWHIRFKMLKAGMRGVMFPAQSLSPSFCFRGAMISTFFTRWWGVAWVEWAASNKSASTRPVRWTRDPVRWTKHRSIAPWKQELDLGGVDFECLCRVAIYRAGLKKSGPQVARIFQASWGRSGKQQQEQNSPNLGTAFWTIPVF